MCVLVMCNERFIFLLSIFSSIYLYTSSFNVDTEFPIIYEDPSHTNLGRGSYFGFSILLQNEGYDGKPWIQIGAPRGNSSVLQVVEPGVVFRCPIKGHCQEIVLENKVEEFLEKGLYIIDSKEHAWLGGSMDSEPGSEGRYVVCGHRWVNKYYLDIKEYYMAGVCYWSYTHENISVNSFTKLLPTTLKKNLLFNLPSSGRVYYFANAQTGMSVHFTNKKEDNIAMLVGAPGLLNWRGGIILYENEKNVPVDNGLQKRSTKENDFADPNIPNPYLNRQTISFDYLGYQVNSGSFFQENDLCYVASAPRGATYKGYVIIFKFSDISNDNTDWIINQKMEGSQTGEYFGASLAVADINGDHLDDLVVGAPLFSVKGDEGRITVYLGKNGNRLVDARIGHKIEGIAAGGRFGTTVTALGDIDQDGYADIAVGAPYEDDYRGVIYIFNGGSDGLRPTHSQRIKAKDVDLNLRGFGISIARPTDIDGNMYADVAVGSFLSGHVVLFRTYPVVTLHLDIWSNTTQLKLNDTYLTLYMCQWYSGKNTPDYVNVIRLINVDDKYNRVYEGGDEIKNVVRLKSKNTTCEQYQIVIKPDKNNNRDFEIKVSQELINDTSVKSDIWVHKDNIIGHDRFCKTCPVRREGISMKTLHIPYALECDSNICNSDLHLECKLMHMDKYLRLSTSYVIGSDSIMQLHMFFSVDKDPAYSTNVEVTIPKGISLLNISRTCDENREENTTVISCSVDNPLRNRTKKSLILFLDMSGVSSLLLDSGESPILQLDVVLNSTSEEKNIADNICKPSFKLTTEADITITGKSDMEIYYYFNLDKNHTESVIEFDHIYQVEKIGASPLQEVEIKFYLPINWQDNDKGINFLDVFQPMAYQNGQPLTCKSDLEYVSVTEELHQPPQMMVPLESPGLVRMKREALPEGLVPPLEPKVSQYHPPSNRTLYLNCSTKQVRCATVTCFSREFVNPSTFARLQLKMKLNVTALESLMKKKDIIYFSTDGNVQITNPKNIQHVANKWPDSTTVSSTFIGSVIEEEIETWIIVLSVIAGILLFFLLVMGLVKAGFFQRKKKEELKALIESTATNEIPANARRSVLEEDAN